MAAIATKKQSRRLGVLEVYRFEFDYPLTTPLGFEDRITGVVEVKLTYMADKDILNPDIEWNLVLSGDVKTVLLESNIYDSLRQQILSELGLPRLVGRL